MSIAVAHRCDRLGPLIIISVRSSQGVYDKLHQVKWALSDRIVRINKLIYLCVRNDVIVAHCLWKWQRVNLYLCFVCFLKETIPNADRTSISDLLSLNIWKMFFEVTRLMGTIIRTSENVDFSFNKMRIWNKTTPPIISDLYGPTEMKGSTPFCQCSPYTIFPTSSHSYYYPSHFNRWDAQQQVLEWPRWHCWHVFSPRRAPPRHVQDATRQHHVHRDGAVRPVSMAGVKRIVQSIRDVSWLEQFPPSVVIRRDCLGNGDKLTTEVALGVVGRTLDGNHRIAALVYYSLFEN